jgi:hypothetical protein
VNAYAVVGFLVAFGASGCYAAYTLLESRRVAAKVLALQQAADAQDLHSAEQRTQDS